MIIDNKEFQKALPVLKKIESFGYQAYFVGGCIRDALLGLTSHDVDIATSAFPEEIQAIFPKHFDVGLEHGTVMAYFNGDTYEITTFRTESEYEDYRRPKEVTFVRSLEEDLLRRDFTINAMAMDTEGQLIDYFQGQEDLKAGRLRAVGKAHDRFQEDALRMMRAVRFASQLGFELETDTAQAIKDSASLLEKIAVERIETEMAKLWQGQHWQAGLSYFIDLELYRYCPLTEVGQASFQKMLDVLSPQQFFPSDTFAWAIYFFLAKRDLQFIDDFTRAWKMSNKQNRLIKKYFLALTARQETQCAWTAQLLYRFGLKTAQTVEIFIQGEGQAMSEFARHFPKGEAGQVEAIWEALPIHSRKDLALNGRDIIADLAPDDKRLIGLYLNQAEAAVLAGQCPNSKADLLAYLKANQ